MSISIRLKGHTVETTRELVTVYKREMKLISGGFVASMYNHLTQMHLIIYDPNDPNETKNTEFR